MWPLSQVETEGQYALCICMRIKRVVLCNDVMMMKCLSDPRVGVMRDDEVARVCVSVVRRSVIVRTSRVGLIFRFHSSELQS